VREDNVREALKRILPFKPTAAQKRVLAELAADLEKKHAHESLAAGRCRQRQDDCFALQASVIAIENGCQAALMAPKENPAVQHFLSARHILEKGRTQRELAD